MTNNGFLQILSGYRISTRPACNLYWIYCRIKPRLKATVQNLPASLSSSGKYYGFPLIFRLPSEKKLSFSMNSTELRFRFSSFNLTEITKVGA